MNDVERLLGTIRELEANGCTYLASIFKELLIEILNAKGVNDEKAS